MRNMENIVSKVLYDKKLKYHTNSAHPIDENTDRESLITHVQNSFPDCRVYVATMVSGIYDNKTYIEERVRRDLKKFVENPRLCVVVDWSSL
jgi:hypothetical protein